MSYCSVQNVATFESFYLDSDGHSSVKLINHRFSEDTVVENTYPPGLYIWMLGRCECQPINDNIELRQNYNHQYVVALVD